MEITLKVDTYALKTKANEVENYINSLESEFNNVQDIISRTSGYWSGIAGSKARDEFSKQKEEMRKILKRFKEHPSDLLTMAGVYEEAEHSSVSENKTLNTDVII